jgi:hypothetical protein
MTVAGQDLREAGGAAQAFEERIPSQEEVLCQVIPGASSNRPP